MIINAEIADSPTLLSQGLMYRQSLPENEGMLFKFPSAIEASFWGKNTYIPLDVAFIGRDNKIAEIHPIVPLSTKQVRSKGICALALEVNAGFFRNNNIRIGTKVEITEKDGKAQVNFVKENA